MQNISSDWSKFTQVSVAKNIKLNSIVNVEKHIRDLLKDFKSFEVISKTVYKILKPRGPRLGILNGICKTHKMLVDDCPTFWPFMPGIKAPTNNVAKLLVMLPKPITTNMYIIKNSFEFAKEIFSQDPGLFMVSLDVESLFTKILLDQTIKVCREHVWICSLLRNDAKVNKLPELILNFSKFFSILKEKPFPQIDGVAREKQSPLGHTFVNAFLCFHQQI